ncbi:fork head domain-containing protein [Radiomyces spectabilis]|uniref:fork head domain-containing protein n=1 Tax=Radiomyces spectabilis TaxID=64574 RepID=UPI00221EC74B|nr:fork head domain-containing protein [Radiomyces spectabilis]KAI8374490.1 fork head domain-containing protein [Radiomyces spectabilis]
MEGKSKNKEKRKGQGGTVETFQPLILFFNSRVVSILGLFFSQLFSLFTLSHPLIFICILLLSFVFFYYFEHTILQFLLELFVLLNSSYFLVLLPSLLFLIYFFFAPQLFLSLNSPATPHMNQLASLTGPGDAERKEQALPPIPVVLRHPHLIGSVKQFRAEAQQQQLRQHIVSESFVPVAPGLIKPPRRRRRPPFSYSSLIAQAILESENKRMTLREIYAWITQKYPALYNADDTGWQNTIRHNLSLNRCFIKLPKSDTNGPTHKGKGGYWAIDPQYVSKFKNGAAAKRGHSLSRQKDQPNSNFVPDTSANIPFHQNHAILNPTCTSPAAISSTSSSSSSSSSSPTAFRENFSLPPSATSTHDTYSPFRFSHPTKQSSSPLSRESPASTPSRVPSSRPWNFYDASTFSDVSSSSSPYFTAAGDTSTSATSSSSSAASSFMFSKPSTHHPIPSSTDDTTKTRATSPIMHIHNLLN